MTQSVASDFIDSSWEVLPSLRSIWGVAWGKRVGAGRGAGVGTGIGMKSEKRSL